MRKAALNNGTEITLYTRHHNPDISKWLINKLHKKIIPEPFWPDSFYKDYFSLQEYWKTFQRFTILDKEPSDGLIFAIGYCFKAYEINVHYGKNTTEKILAFIPN